MSSEVPSSLISTQENDISLLSDDSDNITEPADQKIADSSHINLEETSSDEEDDYDTSRHQPRVRKAVCIGIAFESIV